MNRVRCLASAVLLCLATGLNAVPSQISYQGRLTDAAGAPMATTATVTFTFWDSPSGGTQRGSFADTRSLVPGPEGVVSVQIGGAFGNPLPPLLFFEGDDVWLNVNVNGNDLVPRLRISSVGFAYHAAAADTAEYATTASALGTRPASAYATTADIAGRLGLSGAAYVIVPTTDSAATNGDNLLAAYASARTLTPHGMPLADTNRAVVILPPGVYALGSGSLTLDTEFVDLVGLTSVPDAQHVTGTGDGPTTGVLRNTANNVRIENLWVEAVGSTHLVSNSDSDPAAFYPEPFGFVTVVRNCKFSADEVHAWSMRVGINYFGFYSYCVGGAYAFGGLGEASGVFTNCLGGDFAFGGDGMTADGTFSNCQGGYGAFCGHSGVGPGGNAGGNFVRCVGGFRSFGGAFGTTEGGHFYYCTGSTASFPATFTGVYLYCIKGDVAFP